MPHCVYTGRGKSRTLPAPRRQSGIVAYEKGKAGSRKQDALLTERVKRDALLTARRLAELDRLLSERSQ